jgi:hypothetical protein
VTEPTQKDRDAQRHDAVKAIRSLVFFLLGFAVFIHEAFFVKEIRIELIAASLALMGLPAVLKADEVRRNGE